MKSQNLQDDIREANLTYLILAQRMLRADPAEGMFRLGLTEDVAEIVAGLTTAQLIKIAASPMLMCRFRFDDETVWKLLAGGINEGAFSGLHAAILMSTPAMGAA